MSGKNLWNSFWRISAFHLTIAAGILFFVLTAIAMLVYPGSTLTNHHSRGYSFFFNFLSDLGRFSTPSGQSNLPSMVLFTIALSIGALGIALFFTAFSQLFSDSTGLTLWFSRLGTGAGLLASICFLGVAAVPMDLSEFVHNFFLDTAFVTFVAAFLLIFLAVLRKPDLPRRVVGVFVAFGIVLITYTLLLISLLLFGPPPGSPLWEIIQATGQKVIVSSSLLTALIQAFIVPPLLLKNTE